MEKLYGIVRPGREYRSQRNGILETLLRKIADLEEENISLKRDLLRTVEMRNEYMAHTDRGGTAINVLQTEIMVLLGRMSMNLRPEQNAQEHDLFLTNTPFVIALIDGNRTMLPDEYIKQGRIGGRLAVTRLHDNLMQYLIRRKIFQAHWRLIIKFYASMNNLGTSYMRSGVIEELGTWREFIDGFNERHPLSYFIDAGDKRDQTGEKIQDQLQSFLEHQNCKHTVLVGSRDVGYAGLLRQYMKSDEICDRITVVEAIPSPGEFEEVLSRFIPPKMDSLFPREDMATYAPPENPKERSDIPQNHLMPHKVSRRPTKLVTAPFQPPLSTRPAMTGPSALPLTPTKGYRRIQKTSCVSRTAQVQPSCSMPVPSSADLTAPIRNSSEIPRKLVDSAEPQPPSSISSSYTPSRAVLLTPTKSSTRSNLSTDASQSLVQRSKSKSASEITPLRDPRTSQIRTPQSRSPRNQEQKIHRKPLADIQTRLPRLRSTFFNAQGQRVDSKAYVKMYTQRYLEG